MAVELKYQQPFARIVHCILKVGGRADLEAGGDGGILVVRSLRISDEVIPAGEELPAEGESAVLGSVSPLVGIPRHANMEAHRGQIQWLLSGV